jgi:hypothetical protein
MMLILMSNYKLWIVDVASKSFRFYWVYCLIKVIVFWDFQSKETVVEEFDMIVEKNNVVLEVNMNEYPQKLNKIMVT